MAGRPAAGGPDAPRSHAAFLALALVSLAFSASPETDPGAIAVVTLGEGAVVRARAAALVMSGQEGGALGVSALAFALPGEGPDARGRHPVAVLVEAAATDLAGAGEAELLVYALGEGLEVLARRAHTLQLPQTPGGTERMALLTRLDLPPGAHTVRALLQTGDRFGLRTAPVEVPEDEAALRVPAFFPTAGVGLLALAPPPAGFGAPPFRRGDEILLPSAFPLLPPGSVAVLLVGAMPSGPVTAILKPQEEAQVEGPEPGSPEPRPLEPRPLEAGEVFPLGPGGLMARELRLDATRLEPGLYRLALETPDGRRTPPLRVGIAAPTALAARGEGREARSGEAERPSAEQSLPPPDRAAMRRAYLEALEELAAGRPQTARERLRALEVRAHAADRLAPLSIVQGKVVARLERRAGSGGAGALLPVALLHAAMAAEHASGSAAIARHASTLAERLAERLAREDGEAGSAATLLTRLAELELRAEALQRADQLLVQALTFHPDHPAALELRSSLLEKQGRLEEAGELFERLIRVRPGHLEARLRHAVGQARLGRDGASRELRKLAGQQRMQWAAQLASAEVARLESARGDLEAAEAALRRGLDRWPGHPRLTVQLAAVLDDAGRGAEAREAIHGLDGAGGGGPSERERYNRWQRAELAAQGQVVEHLAAERLPALAGALAAEAAGR